MRLSDKAQAALNKVIEQFKRGDLGPVVEIARIRRRPGDEVPADNWSLSNRIMAYIQTGSLDCRGYRQWQAAGRHVKKGAQAGYILVPLMKTVETDDGEKAQALRGFKGVAVFGYHDTDGEPLPEHDYTPRQLPPLTGVARQLGVAVTWQPLPPDRLGDCSPDGRRINVGTEDAAVFFHELAHAAHARLNGGKLEGGQHAGQETVAEFTAAVLMALYGLGDRTGNAWRYVAGYASDPLLAIVKALSTVEKVLALLGV